jgi:hypothetical protein
VATNSYNVSSVLRVSILAVFCLVNVVKIANIDNGEPQNGLFSALRA